MFCVKLFKEHISGVCTSNCTTQSPNLTQLYQICWSNCFVKNVWSFMAKIGADF